MDRQSKALLIRILPVLFFLSLIGEKDQYLLFHGNQALIQFILALVGTGLNKIPLIGGLLSLAVGGFCLFFWVIGVMSASQGKMRPLPLVGHIHLID